MARTDINRYGRTCETCGDSFVHKDTRNAGRFCSSECFNLSKQRSLAERFQEHIGTMTETGCVLWTGSKTAGGYGRLHKVVDGKPGSIYAHRVSYELAHGPIPDGMHVLHRCDNPPCVNADHLFLGTDADNVADMIAKRRGIIGVMNCNAKLTEDAVRSIRERYAKGNITQNRLAREFNVDDSTVYAIVHRKRWKHI